jgi:hypothetical protein
VSLAAQVGKDRLDDVARLAWLGYAEGRLDDSEAQAVAIAVEQRRGRMPWQRAKAECMAPPLPAARRERWSLA